MKMRPLAVLMFLLGLGLVFWARGTAGTSLPPNGFGLSAPDLIGVDNGSTAKGDGTGCADEEKTVWVKFEDALKLAKENGRPLVLLFWAPGCRPCQMLEDKGFNKPSIACYVNAKFYPVRINVRERADLRERFKVTATPTVWFLTPEGKEIDFFVGYLPPERLFLILRYIGDGAYKTKTFEEFEKEQQH